MSSKALMSSLYKKDDYCFSGGGGRGSMLFYTSS
jgi:hypothetical protein